MFESLAIGISIALIFAVAWGFILSNNSVSLCDGNCYQGRKCKCGAKNDN